MMKNQRGRQPLASPLYPLISAAVLCLLLSVLPWWGGSSANAQTNSQLYLPVIAPGQGAESGTPTGEKPSEKPTATATATPPTPDPVVTPTATTAQPVETPTTLPTSQPVSPYVTLLAQARERCQATAVNHACLAQGTAAGFSQVGETIAFTQPITMSVRSSGVDVEQWSVLLLRLQAPGEETITQTLELLAVGQVDISVLQLFTSTAVAPGVPVLRLASQPLSNGAERAPSGLLVLNGASSELLSIAVNQAAITLDGAAFIQTHSPAGLQAAAQSGPIMTLAVEVGSAQLQVADAASTVIAGSQVQAPLDAQGNASGAPSAEAPTADDLLTPLVLDDTLVPLTRGEQVAEMHRELTATMYKCSYNQHAPSVYRAFYYLRQLNTPANRSFISQALWDTVVRDFKKCVRFEVIFDSAITGNTSIVWHDHVHSDAAFIQFDVDGTLVAAASSPLKHVQVEMQTPVCQLQSIASPDGTFAVTQASLRIHYNTMKVAMKTFPYMTLEQIPTGTFICPAPAPPLVVPIEWNTTFIQLHPELWLPQPIYLLQEEHWKYTGRQIFAEAIFAGRSAPFADGMIHSDSYFILRHAPLQ